MCTYVLSVKNANIGHHSFNGNNTMRLISNPNYTHMLLYFLYKFLQFHIYFHKLHVKMIEEEKWKWTKWKAAEGWRPFACACVLRRFSSVLPISIEQVLCTLVLNRKRNYHHHTIISLFATLHHVVYPV